MGLTKIVLIDPLEGERTIAATGQTVAHGEEVEVDSELAESLLEQSDVWARPTTKAAKAAKEG